MMRKKRERMLLAEAPVVVGTGLVALDVILSQSSAPPRVAAGGTCGNVMTILGFLGWESYPVARLGEDAAAELIVNDLSRYGVRLDFARCKPGGRTATVIESIGRNVAGESRHRFGFRCPLCGARYPGYQAVCAKSMLGVIEQIRKPAVCFVDRLSRGALMLAKASAAQGALVVFEPSANSDPRLFGEAMGLAHIVKYSASRANDVGAMWKKSTVLVEIETCGHEGLRFRSRLPGGERAGWRRVEAYSVAEVLDSAGCGDWCTACVIDKIGQQGVAGLSTATDASLIQALKFGQAAAAWNCGFEGARGGMECVNRAGFEAEARRIMAGKVLTSTIQEHEVVAVKQLLEGLCSGCGRRPKVKRSNASRKKHVGKNR
jgi:sugar/nucleoside kinase (ribokinase family)